MNKSLFRPHTSFEWRVPPDLDALLQATLPRLGAAAQGELAGLAATFCKVGAPDLDLPEFLLADRGGAGPSIVTAKPWEVLASGCPADLAARAQLFARFTHFDMAEYRQSLVLAWSESSAEIGFDMRQMLLFRDALVLLDSIHDSDGLEIDDISDRSQVFLRPAASAHQRLELMEEISTLGAVLKAFALSRKMLTDEDDIPHLATLAPSR